MGLNVRSKAKKLTLIYSVHDDAIIEDESDRAAYVESHDVGNLVFEEVNDDEDMFGPVEFWCRIPSWEEAEPLFWSVIGDTKKFVCELFRRYCEEFRNYRWRNEKGEILTVQCARVREPGVGMVIRDQVLEAYVAVEVQQDIGTGIAVLGGLLKSAEESLIEITKMIDEETRVIPGGEEQEKNS